LNRRLFGRKSAGWLAVVGSAFGVKTAGAERLSTPMAWGNEPWLSSRLSQGSMTINEVRESEADALPAVHLFGVDWPAGAKRIHVQSKVARLNESYTANWKGKPKMIGADCAVVRVYLNRDGTTTYEFIPTEHESELKREDEPVGTFS
jgi:hypothetical protein